MIKEYMQELDLEYVELSEVSTLQQRVLHKMNIADNLKKIACELKEYGHVRFGTFHTYPHSVL